MRRLRSWFGAGRRLDAAIIACYLLGAIYVTARLWDNLRHRVQSDNVQDQIFFEWVLARAARVVTHFENPFFTMSLNYPAGVNMIANTSVLAIGIPLAPVTLLFGSHVTYAVALVLGLAGTATTWYWVLSRHIVTNRVAAIVGGAFCGFAPAMVSHANGHPNIVSQFLVPLIIWRVIALREPGRVIRNGVILGLLITYQVFLNEEILLFTALALGVFFAAYAAQRWREVAPILRRFLGGLGVAGGLVAALVAYPLYIQFFGPQHYKGMEHWFQLSTDLSTFTAFPRRSIALYSGVSPGSAHPAEENTFLGWPLMALVVIMIVWQWRDATVRCIAIVGAVFAALSLGSVIVFRGTRTGIPGPWALLDDLPIFESVVPIRIGLVLVPTVGLLLALGVDRFLTETREPAPNRDVARLAGLLVLAVALVPLTPVPLLAKHRDAAPTFITAGGWREYVTGGRTLVPVPLPTYPEPTGMWWSSQTGVAFPIPRGYFLGPQSGESGDIGDLAPPPRRTSTLLSIVERTGRPARVTDVDRRVAREDLRYWNAGVVVLDVNHLRAAALRVTLENLLGPGTRRDGVWLWDASRIRVA